ncbi:MAG: molybdopterin-dependent oxidoreductase [Rhodospirillales bacterium]|nr:molybdopterin-dependent oxidoreductase [Rhodospirillales bacterium]MDP6643323.1 molybdopterin-dependent oxidoreductase [Rhodospirillales bacterium]MDP6840065.1 molybdopterin-dependent oxidoreductase [Rhodospirillales bacterium]
MSQGSTPYVGRAMERVEDAVLLSASAKFADDMPTVQGTLHAAILRSPHASAEILSIDTSAAERQPGVAAVLTGADVEAVTSPFLIVVKQPMDQWCLATDRVRFVGEAVAVVIADDRYLAEDAVDLIEVEYKPLEPVIDPLDAAKDDAPLVHVAVGSNVVSSRDFTYGDPDNAFAEADHTVELSISYPRNSHTPLEGYVVVAEYDTNGGVFDVMSNFQGPFTVHPVMARALGVPGSKLRMRTAPFSGGGFGVKQAIFPYVVLCCVAAKKVGRPVKWVEDRLEHLTAAIAAPNREIKVEAAAMKDGTVTALRYNQLDDYGAYLRPPMPGPLYRQHGVMTGPYDIPHMAITNRLVMTNKTPSGMVRGFGGPQSFYALESIMRRVAEVTGLDHLEVIRKNLVPKDAFPYRATGGALLDSGDYQAAVDVAVDKGKLEALRQRRDEARKEGRLYGIGMAAVSDPAQSNMGYLSTIQTVEERHKSGLKGGNISYATVNMEPLGAISVTCDSIPQGQGHATVLSQIVADQLGVSPDDIRVNTEHDTHKDPWSIATGNYSCRFSSASAVACQRAAQQIRDKLTRIAAPRLNVKPEDIDFADGLVFARDNPDNSLKLHRVAGVAHWQPGELPEGMEPGMRAVGTWAPPELEPPNDQDQINTSLTYGFVFDFCGVEIDRDTGQVHIDKYVTVHDSGTILNPLLKDGQTYGAFAWGVGCALMEEFVYGDNGEFLSGTFADYLPPTACEIPTPELYHISTPTPLTPLGAKGGAEGNVMTTPVCLANAVCDALGLESINLPMTPKKISAIIHGEEAPRPAAADAAPETAPEAEPSGRALAGTGGHSVPATPEAVWQALIDPVKLAAVIPGCHQLDLVGDNQYRAEVTLGVGPVSGRFKARVRLSEMDAPNSVTLSGELDGPLGSSVGSGRVSLTPSAAGTDVSYDYRVEVSGKVAAIGGRMLDGATRVVIGQFFKRLTANFGGPEEAAAAAGGAGRRSLWQWLLRLFGAGK